MLTGRGGRFASTPGLFVAIGFYNKPSFLIIDVKLDGI
jgi:hypothetical protein